MGRPGICTYSRCGNLIYPGDKMGREFGLCPHHARAAEAVLGIQSSTKKNRSKIWHM